MLESAESKKTIRAKARDLLMVLIDSGLSQTKIAALIKETEPTITRIKDEKEERKVGLKTVRELYEKLERLVERQNAGEDLYNIEITLIQPTQGQLLAEWLKCLSKRNVGIGLVVIILPVLASIISIAWNQGVWQGQEEVVGIDNFFKKTFDEQNNIYPSVLTHFFLNLLIALFFSIANLFIPVIQTVGTTTNIKRSIREFSVSWSLLWFCWVILYANLCIAWFWNVVPNFSTESYSAGTYTNVFWAIADIINLVNSGLLLHIFFNMYFKEYDRRLWFFIMPIFGIASWIGISDRFIYWHGFDGIGGDIVSYISGVVALLFIGRLSSLFIKIPFKLLFLAYLNFYALCQMKWGEMSSISLIIFLFAKILLWAYVYEAFFRYNGTLEDYFTRVNNETETSP